MGNIVQAAELIEKYGPWALVAILGFVVWKMAVHIQEQNVKHKAEVVALLREQKEDTRELTEALLTTKQALENMQAALTTMLR